MLTVLLTFPIPERPLARLQAAFQVREALFAEGEALRVAALDCAGAEGHLPLWDGH